MLLQRKYFSFPVVENVDKLEDKHTYINGINSVIQNSIIKILSIVI